MVVGHRKKVPAKRAEEESRVLFRLSLCLRGWESAIKYTDQASNEPIGVNPIKQTGGLRWSGE